MKKNTVLILLVAGSVILILLILFAYHPLKVPKPASPSPSPSTTPIASSNTILGEQTKTSHCVVNGPLPDKDCTPGAVYPTATVDLVCQPGYSKSVRNVPENEKDQVYAEYTIETHTTGQYEVDHLISLELGGSNDIANLWPEAAQPQPGFHEKDKIENYLHDQVCNGTISLQQAQQEIATNWLQVYNTIGH